MKLPLLVDPSWLATHLADPDLVILDATVTIERDRVNGDRIIPGRSGFEAGHIPGAQFIDLANELSDRSQTLWFMVPPPEDFARVVTRLGITETSPTIVYCTGNVWWATRVWWLFRVFGLDNVAVLDGGWTGWVREDRPIETGPGRLRAPGTVLPRVPRTLTVDKGEVLAAIGDPSTCLVNALPAPSHTGEVPSHYGRPGHIAGSVNMPGIEMIDPDTNRFLPPSRIEQQFEARGILKAKTVIAYCGGGITATATAFGLALIGRPDPLIYDASLQEWAPDTTLPMAVGAAP